MAKRIIAVKEKALWVYGLSLPRADAMNALAEPQQRYKEVDEFVPWPLATALGVDHLDHDFVETVFIDDLNKPLSVHLQTMTRMDADVFAGDRAALDAQKGAAVMIIQDPEENTLSRAPAAPFVFLGVFPMSPYTFSLGDQPTAPPDSKPRYAAHVGTSVTPDPDRRSSYLLVAAFVVGVAFAVLAIGQLLL